MYNMLSTPVHLRLDGCCYRLGDRVSVGARVRSGNRDYRRRDLWILRNRQAHHRAEASDNYDERKDNSEDRPLDTKSGNHSSLLFCS